MVLTVTGKAYWLQLQVTICRIKKLLHKNYIVLYISIFSLQPGEQERVVPTAEQQLQHYGEEMATVTQSAMPVASTTNYTMWVFTFNLWILLFSPCWHILVSDCSICLSTFFSFPLLCFSLIPFLSVCPFIFHFYISTSLLHLSIYFSYVSPLLRLFLFFIFQCCFALL